jgi:hypothetical protein
MIIAIDGTNEIDVGFIRTKAIGIDSHSWLSGE